ncbi:hypothetical protein ACHAWF_003986, partial [Thalassiosira exigua]
RPFGASALAATLLLVASVGIAAGADEACVATGDDSGAFSSPEVPGVTGGGGGGSGRGAGVVPPPPPGEYHSRCHVWPPEGVPVEHRDNACDRPAQNARWRAEDEAARAAPRGELIPDEVYLNMPEEGTWVCPEDDAAEEEFAANGARSSRSSRSRHKMGAGSDECGGPYGHPTRWIVRNDASSPILLSHVNPLGVEVSASDFATRPPHASTAVHPRGPVVLPGQTAVVEGRQGQVFLAREYKEILPMDAMILAEGMAEHGGGGGGVRSSWESFKGVLPPTLSFLPQRSRYETNEGVWHVLGSPGRVLMKHRMGNIHVRNEYEAVCPELLGDAVAGDDEDVGRRGNPKDMDPDCNVLRKAFINRVGCPVDLYFAPQNKVEGYDCEVFTSHLGTPDAYLARDPTTRNLDGFNSPLKFENTYNGHSFVARTSHNGSLVARIELERDVVRDCPDPKRGAVGVVAPGGEVAMGAVPVESAVVANASNVWAVGGGVNDTVPPVLVRKGSHVREKGEVLWNNRTGFVEASIAMAS